MAYRSLQRSDNLKKPKACGQTMGLASGQSGGDLLLSKGRADRVRYGLISPKSFLGSGEPADRQKPVPPNDAAPQERAPSAGTCRPPYERHGKAFSNGL